MKTFNIRRMWKIENGSTTFANNFAAIPISK